MAGPNVDFRISGDEKLLQRALARSEKEVDKLKGKLREAGSTGKRAGKEMEGGIGTAASSLTSYLAGLASVSGVVTGISSAWRVYLQNVREVTAETRKASGEMIAFAALQEGGTKAKRVMEVSALMAKYGLYGRRGEGYDAVQALESALDSYELGLQTAETVFAAEHVGIPIEKGLELEVLGAAQKQAPGQALRRAYVAGQASARDPSTLAGAAPGLTFWEDMDLGFAAAGVLAAGVKKDELQTYVKAAGVGLSKGSVAGFQETFAALGVANATRMEKLEALAEAGIDTTEELKLAGLTEIRQQLGVSILVKNLEKLKRIRGEIEAKAMPGILVRHRAEVERELPLLERERTASRLETQLDEEAVHGKFAPRAQERDILQRQRALAFRRMGLEQIGPVDLIENKRSTWWDELAFFLSELRPQAGLANWGMGKRWGEYGEELARIRGERVESNQDLAASLEAAVENGMRGAAAEIETAVERGMRKAVQPTTLGHPDQEPG